MPTRRVTMPARHRSAAGGEGADGRAPAPRRSARADLGIDVTKPAVRARAARLFTAVAAIGVVVSLVGLVAGWIMVGELDRNSRRSLDVTVQSLDSLARTVAVADEVLRTSTTALSGVSDALRAADRSVTSTDELATGVSSLADTLAPALEDTTVTLRQLALVGADIDSVLEGLSNVPLAPDYRPGAGLGPTFGAIADDLDPVPEALRDTSAELQRWQGSTAELRRQLQTLADSVDEVTTGLRDSTELVGGYRSTIAAARAAAEQARADLQTNAVLVRVLLVVGAVAFAAFQTVPWWLGRTLAAEAAMARPTTSPPAPPASSLPASSLPATPPATPPDRRP